MIYDIYISRNTVDEPILEYVYVEKETAKKKYSELEKYVSDKLYYSVALYEYDSEKGRSTLLCYSNYFGLCYSDAEGCIL